MTETWWQPRRCHIVKLQTTGIEILVFRDIIQRTLEPLGILCQVRYMPVGAKKFAQFFIATRGRRLPTFSNFSPSSSSGRKKFKVRVGQTTNSGTAGLMQYSLLKALHVGSFSEKEGLKFKHQRVLIQLKSLISIPFFSLELLCLQ